MNQREQWQEWLTSLDPEDYIVVEMQRKWSRRVVRVVCTIQSTDGDAATVIPIGECIGFNERLKPTDYTHEEVEQ